MAVGTFLFLFFIFIRKAKKIGTGPKAKKEDHVAINLKGALIAFTRASSTTIGYLRGVRTPHRDHTLRYPSGSY
jgi:hypothetical protein